jgi:hypothetical protein
MDKDLGHKIHRAILNEPVTISLTNKKGKPVKKFKIGLLSVREAIKISQLAYGNRLKEVKDMADIHDVITLNQKRLIKIVGIFLKSRSRLPEWYIRHLIRKYTTPADLETMVALIYEGMAVKPFLNSIIQMNGMSLIKQEEIIAYQDQLTKIQEKKETA